MNSFLSHHLAQRLLREMATAETADPITYWMEFGLGETPSLDHDFEVCPRIQQLPDGRWVASLIYSHQCDTSIFYRKILNRNCRSLCHAHIVANYGLRAATINRDRPLSPRF